MKENRHNSPLNDRKYVKRLTDCNLSKKGLTVGGKFAIIINVVTTAAHKPLRATTANLENDTEKRNKVIPKRKEFRRRKNKKSDSERVKRLEEFGKSSALASGWLEEGKQGKD